jgi:uncharacterized membrane protein HdeD (DUF308 family)
MPDTAMILRTYFAGEKSEAMLILLAGVVCLAGAVALWFWVREPFAKGLAASLLLAAAMGIGVGGSVYFRTDTQLRQLTELQQRDPSRFAAEEGPRIRQVVRSFATYRIGYVIAVLGALALIFLLGRPVHHGLAVGLLLLAALGFTIDFFAERRAAEYVQALESTGALSTGR